MTSRSDDLLIGQRINNALNRIRQGVCKTGMATPWHVGKAQEILDDRRLLPKHRVVIEGQGQDYLEHLPHLIHSIEVQDQKCSELWRVHDPNDRGQFESERHKLMELFEQFLFQPKSYEKLVRISEKPLLEQAKRLQDTVPHDWQEIDGLESRLRLTLEEYLEIESGLEEDLRELDRSRAELSAGNEDFALEMAHSQPHCDPTTEQSALYGLRGAAKYYDCTRGYRFTTYAQHWILEAIKQRRTS